MDRTPPSRRRDGAVFRELARLAETTPASGLARAPASDRTENSGLIDLPALTSEPKSAAEPPVSARAVAVDDVPAAHAPVGATKAERRPLRGLFIVAFLGGAVCVAGVLVGMRRPASETPFAIATADRPPQAPGAATLPIVAPASIAASDRELDPSSLPPTDVNGGSGARPSRRSTPVVAAPATATSVSSVVTAGRATAGDGQSLELLMEQAVGVTSASATTTATPIPDAPPSPEGSVTIKPSFGAIRAALGAVLPGARGCLDLDDPISRATITFQSDGSARSVSVSGGAAGKPAEACIRAALMKASVPPFALSTYSVPATIRPD